MTGKVRKAVLPVAGLGTRILPVGKATPKNLLNIVDRPMLAYIVDEARAAGIEHFIFIVGRGQQAIEDYFDAHPELESTLEAKGKHEILAQVRADLPKAGEMSFVRQMAPNGLGHAVWCARDLIGDEPFAVMLPDVIMEAEPSVLKQLIQVHDARGGNVIGVEQVPESETHKYGVIAPGSREGRLSTMTGMVEKPAPGTAPSNLSIAGRYVLQPQIFEALAAHEKGAGGEIQLTDAMARLMADQPFWAYEYEGVTYDCGDKIGLLRANVVLALKRPDLGAAARAAVEQALAG